MKNKEVLFSLMREERWLVFDVDGTLTPTREPMVPGFKSWFMENIPMERVCLITGSDKEKTIAQVGEDFWSQCKYAMQCGGNDTYSRGKHVTHSRWTPSESLLGILNSELSNTKYDELCGNHIEVRTGMENFSIVGRDAVGDQRSRYVDFDLETRDRSSIAKKIREATGLEAVCGGDTGIDIFPKGRDKSQALNLLYKNISFFGDRCDAGGNDYALARALWTQNHKPVSRMVRHHEVYPVSGPYETETELRKLIARL